VLVINLDYSLDLAPDLGFPGYTAKQINLADWYPFIPPHVPGLGWLAHDPADVGENLAYDISDYDIHLRIIDSGKDISICASAPPLISNGIYQFTANSRRNFPILSAIIK
jgi:hypothetical protein